MKKVEQILVIISILSFFMSLLLDRGAMIVVLLLLSLASIYFYLSFALFNDIRFRRIFKSDSYKDVSGTRILGTIILGIFLSLTIIGLIFKFMNLTGAAFNLYGGLAGLLIATIVTAIFYLKSKSGYFLKILTRTLLFGVLGLVLLLIPEKTWVEIKFRNHPKYVEVLKKYIDDPTSTTLDEVEKEQERMAREEN